MKYFDIYRSNTLAGSSNQHFFTPENENEIVRSRTLYKVYAGGEYSYSFLFQGIIDSTFADGKASNANRIADEWTIVDARVGVCSECTPSSHSEPSSLYPITFDGCTEKLVHAGEFFTTDPVTLSADKNEYICLEISFKGKEIPYHPESQISSFVYTDGEWRFSVNHPFAQMVGCKRNVKARVAFLGDSITQGCGAGMNTYAQWCAVAAELVGDDYSYWNLGIGFGRAADMASLGSWFFKAKQNDAAVICYGVNDILQGYTAEAIKKNLTVIATRLRSLGVKVLIQTVPPFNYSPEKTEIWQEVNRYIREELSKETDGIFDCAALLGKSEEEPQIAPYGGHPNAEGCRVWAEALAPVLGDFLTESFN